VSDGHGESASNGRTNAGLRECGGYHAGEWGTIEAIGFRSTRLRTLEGHLITIPDNSLIEQSIHNFESRPSIRRRFRLGLPYGTPPDAPEEALAILRDVLDGHESTPEDAPPRVEFEEFGESMLSVFVQYNYEPPDFYEALAFGTRINLQICRRFEAAVLGLRREGGGLRVDPCIPPTWDGF